jgi:GT2 family glycosyltransferase
METQPLVTVVIVVRNEYRDIVGALESVQQQDYRPLEVLVVDGMSSDGTRELVQNYLTNERTLAIRLLDNSPRIQATGWNIGIREAKGNYVLRLDAVHCRLTPNYVKRCLDKLFELQTVNPNVVAVGGRRMSVSASRHVWSEAIALAQCSHFGVGNARYRLGSKAGFTDTLGVPLYERRVLLQVGLFNELLGRSEDNELHARLRRRGFQLYFFPEVTSIYYPRSTLSELVSQMFRNGWWVSATIRREHAFPFGLRHLIPLMFYTCIILLTVLTLLDVPFAGMSLYALATLYVTASVGAALESARALLWWRIVIVFWYMHASYAGGTIAGCFASTAGEPHAKSRSGPSVWNVKP